MKHLAQHLIRAGVASTNKKETLRKTTVVPDSWHPEFREDFKQVKSEEAVEEEHPKRRRVTEVRPEPVTFLLTKGDRRRVDQYARRHKYRSLSECIRDLLLEGLDNPPPKKHF